MLAGSASRADIQLRWFLAGALVALFSPGCSRASAPRGALRIVVGSGPLSLDPHLQNEAVTRSILGNVYDALVELGPEMSVVPALAERWDSPDDVTWRFSLREAYFHDGRRLAADDVVFSLERAWHHPRSKLAGYLGGL